MTDAYVYRRLQHILKRMQGKSPGFCCSQIVHILRENTTMVEEEPRKHDSVLHSNFTDPSSVHHFTETVVNSLSILLNSYLLYLILRHSTLYLRIYRRVLLIACWSDLSLSIVILLGQPVRLSGLLK